MKHYTEIQSSLVGVQTPNGNAIFCSDFTGRNSIADKGSGDKTPS
jgi:hypothetical protein